jgi:hypothetical protein
MAEAISKRLSIGLEPSVSEEVPLAGFNMT